MGGPDFGGGEYQPPFNLSGSAEDINITTNDVSSGNSKLICLKTGDASAGDSGAIKLETGTASGTRGKIQFLDGTEGTPGDVWTSIDAFGNGAWVTGGGGGGANTALSNLVSPTAINQDLLPGSADSFDIGSLSDHFRDIFATSLNSQTANFYSTITPLATILAIADNAVPTTPSGVSIDFSFRATENNDLGIFTVNSTSASPSGRIAIDTGNNTSTGNTGNLQLTTGDANSVGTTGLLDLITGDQSGSGLSGGITLTTGTTTSNESGSITFNTGNSSADDSGAINLITGTAAGTRGRIEMDASAIDHNQVTSEAVVWESGATGSRPGGPVLGQRFFDTTIGLPIWYDGTNWIDAAGNTV